MDIQPLEALLQRGVDNAVLRFTLGAHYLKVNEPGTAVEHLQQSLKWSPDYSAAWKLLGKAHALHGDTGAAHDAWTQGMAVAERNGDKQAGKEMQVFLRRLQRSAQEAARITKLSEAVLARRCVAGSTVVRQDAATTPEAFG